MIFSDLALSRRLERAEGDGCAQFASARRRLFPASGSEWIELAGAYVVFDGVDSPVTQCFGLGVSEALNSQTLDVVERFFFDRGAPVQIELSPHAGVPAVDLLCSRGYRPIEISSVMWKSVDVPMVPADGPIRVRVVAGEDVAVWNDVAAKGWAQEHPELIDFLLEIGAISAAKEDTVCFLADLDGVPGAAGALCLHEGVALFSGAATVPTLRRNGLQGALLEARMRYASSHGCDLAMMVAEVGSNSQRNAERKGFRIAYTRTKWRLALS